MNMPGFTAESSLFGSRAGRSSVLYDTIVEESGQIVPQHRRVGRGWLLEAADLIEEKYGGQCDDSGLSGCFERRKEVNVIGYSDFFECLKAYCT